MVMRREAGAPGSQHGARVFRVDKRRQRGVNERKTRLGLPPVPSAMGIFSGLTQSSAQFTVRKCFIVLRTQAPPLHRSNSCGPGPSAHGRAGLRTQLRSWKCRAAAEVPKGLWPLQH